MALFRRYPFKLKGSSRKARLFDQLIPKRYGQQLRVVAQRSVFGQPPINSASGGGTTTAPTAAGTAVSNFHNKASGGGTAPAPTASGSVNQHGRQLGGGGTTSGPTSYGVLFQHSPTASRAIEVGRTQYGTDYATRAGAPSGGMFISAWVKIKDPGNMPFTVGNTDALIIKGPATTANYDWYIRTPTGNCSANSQTDARYNANTMLFAHNPGNFSVDGDWVGDYSYYEQTALATEVTGWVWVAWWIQVLSDRFIIKQWLKFGVLNAVGPVSTSTILFSDARTILQNSYGWSGAQIANWIPQDIASIQVGSDNGFMTKVRVYPMTADPTTQWLTDVAMGQLLDSTAWASWHFEWNQSGGTPDLADYSGNGRNLTKAGGGTLYQGPFGPYDIVAVHSSGGGTASAPTASGGAAAHAKAGGGATTSSATAAGSAKAHAAAAGGATATAPTAAGGAKAHAKGAGGANATAPSGAGTASAHAPVVSTSGGGTASSPTAVGAAKARSLAGGAGAVPAPTAAGSSKAHTSAGGGATTSSPAGAGTSKARAQVGGGATAASPSAAGGAKARARSTGAATATSPTAASVAAAHAKGSGAGTATAPTASGSIRNNGGTGGGGTASAPTAQGAVGARAHSAGAATATAPTAAGVAPAHVKAAGGGTATAPTGTGAGNARERLAGGATTTAPSATGGSKAHAKGAGAATTSTPVVAGGARAKTTAGGAGAVPAPTAAGSFRSGNPGITGGGTATAPVASGGARAHVRGAGAGALPGPTGAGLADQFRVQAGGAGTASAPTSAGLSSIAVAASGAGVVPGPTAAGGIESLVPFAPPPERTFTARMQPHVFVAKVERVTLTAAVSARVFTTRTKMLNDHLLGRASKATGETLDYQVRWMLETGETISAATWTAEGCTILGGGRAPDIIDGTKTRAWVSGGAADTTATISVTVTTSAGRVLERYFLLDIQ